MLLHEAHHAEGKGYDGGNNDSSRAYNGAWRGHVCWLAWVAYEGVGTSLAMRTQATQRANNILNSKLATLQGSALYP